MNHLFCVQSSVFIEKNPYLCQNEIQLFTLFLLFETLRDVLSLLAQTEQSIEKSKQAKWDKLKTNPFTMQNIYGWLSGSEKVQKYADVL